MCRGRLVSKSLPRVGSARGVFPHPGLRVCVMHDPPKTEHPHLGVSTPQQGCHVGCWYIRTRPTNAAPVKHGVCSFGAKRHSRLGALGCVAASVGIADTDADQSRNEARAQLIQSAYPLSLSSQLIQASLPTSLIPLPRARVLCATKVQHQKLLFPATHESTLQKVHKVIQEQSPTTTAGTSTRTIWPASRRTHEKSSRTETTWEERAL